MSLGIAPRVVSGRLQVAVVGLDRSDGVEVVANFTYRVDANEDFPQQVRSLVHAVHPFLTGGVDVVVISSFDYRSSQRIENWVKLRLRAEGALAVMAREHSGHVRIMNGREMATVLNCSKADLIQMATDAVPDLDADAVMAAWTAEALAVE